MISLKNSLRVIIPLGIFSLTFATGFSAAETLNNATVRQILTSARQQIAKNNATGCVAVTDEQGLLLGFERLDGAPPGCVDAAIGKAKTSALYRSPSVKFMQRLQKGEYTVLAVPNAVALGGGYPLHIEKKVVGAVGISTPQQALDNQIAENIGKAISTVNEKP